MDRGSPSRLNFKFSELMMLSPQRSVLWALSIEAYQLENYYLIIILPKFV